MKLFVLNSLQQPMSTPQLVLDSSNVYGVSMDCKLGQFMMGGSNFSDIGMGLLTTEIKKIALSGKKVGIAVMCGDFARNIAGVRYVTLQEKHHQGSTDADPTWMSVPVFYQKEYKDYLYRFFDWFYNGLVKDSKVWDAIDHVKVAGVVQKSPEFRTLDQHFLPSGDPYNNAALVWKAEGYTSGIVKSALEDIIRTFCEKFWEKQRIIQIISGLSGWVCIKGEEICYPNQRENIGKWIINSVTKPIGVMPGWCFLNTTSTPPAYVSDVPCFYQTENNSNITYAQLEAAIEYGRAHNGEIIEMQWTIFRKYPMIIA